MGSRRNRDREIQLRRSEHFEHLLTATIRFETDGDIGMFPREFSDEVRPHPDRVTSVRPDKNLPRQTFLPRESPGSETMFDSSELHSDPRIKLQKGSAGGSQVNSFLRPKEEGLSDNVFQYLDRSRNTRLSSSQLNCRLSERTDARDNGECLNFFEVVLKGA